MFTGGGGIALNPSVALGGPSPFLGGNGLALFKNQYGQHGAPDHVATVARLKEMAKQEFQGRDVEIRTGTSILDESNINRRPDVSVIDRKQGQF